MRQHIVADNEIRWPVFSPKALRHNWSKKLADCGDAFFTSYCGDVLRWLDTCHRNSMWQKVLQQIAVITRNFDHKTVLVERHTRNYHFNIFFCMSYG